MAAKRKPSIRNVRKSKAEPEVEAEETVSNEELIITHLHGIHVAMNAIAEQLKVLADVGLARNDLLEQRAEQAEPAITGAEPAAEPQKRRGRRTNAEIAAAKNAEIAASAAATAAAVAGVEKPTPPPAPAKEPEHVHDLEPLARPGLARCKTCNAVVDVPVEQKPPEVAKLLPAATQTVEVTKPPPTNNGAIPSANDLRAVAITFAGVHGKPKLSEVLKKYGCTNIAGVPEESRAALMAELAVKES